MVFPRQASPTGGIRKGDGIRSEDQPHFPQLGIAVKLDHAGAMHFQPTEFVKGHRLGPKARGRAVDGKGNRVGDHGCCWLVFTGLPGMRNSTGAGAEKVATPIGGRPYV